MFVSTILSTQFKRTYFRRAAMRATEFECRHPTLIHQIIVGLAFLTYLIDREDGVWRFVKDTATPHRLERFVFIGAALFIAVGCGICTWARAYHKSYPATAGEPTGILRYPGSLGDLCFAIGLGSFAPLAGFVILVGGETLRVVRLKRCDDQLAQSPWQPALPLPANAVQEDPEWGKAFRKEVVKWGLLVTMTVFVITLNDLQAEVLAAASFLVGMFINPPARTQFVTGRQ